MQNVMIDLETLGVTADAVIMSIGAVEFELDGQLGETFYRSVSIDSNLQLRRTIDESTLIFWMDDSDKGAGPSARKVFKEAKIPLQCALFDLASAFGWTDGTLVWSNGAPFDIPMLEHAYRQCSIELPWGYSSSRCVRTYRALPGAHRVPRPAPGVAHNALDDAIAQAKYVQAIHQALFAKEGVVA